MTEADKSIRWRMMIVIKAASSELDKIVSAQHTRRPRISSRILPNISVSELLDEILARHW